MWHVGGRTIHTGFWWRNLRERDHLEHFGVDWMIILKRIFKTSVERERNGLMWFRIVVGEGML